MKILLKLYGLFFKIGIMTFGGGYAMLPILERELADKRSYTTREEIMDFYAVSQCTPGVIAVNTATFIGCKIKGILGGIFATLGVVSPSIVIITILARLLEFLVGNEIAASAFARISVAVCAVIVKALTGLTKSGITDVFTAVIAAAAFVCTLVLKISPIIIIVSAAVLGVVYKSFIYGKIFKKEEKK